MMGTKTRIAAIACLGTSVLFAAALTARAEDSTVSVTLEDSSMSDGMPKNDTMPDMKMVLDHTVVHSGKVTIRATNASKTMIHEVIVFRDTGALLPYSDEAAKLVEKQMNSLGEVSDLDPGKSNYRVFTLTPGNYLLICNQPQHFKRGMWARLKVVAESAPIANAGAPSAVRPATKAVQLPPGEEDEGS
jgi:uncharacterized cupredoxin-like copper-binding protein